jgi:hypothetical protein
MTPPRTLQQRHRGDYSTVRGVFGARNPHACRNRQYVPRAATGAAVACLNDMRVIIFLVLASVFAFPAIASAQSRCADCHFANMQASFARHISDWERSAHGTAGVGCERCHGGYSTTFEPALAHRDILPVGHRGSPLHRLNLPSTCGACHTGPLVAFQTSRHYELLRSGSLDGPTCSTCHDEVGATLLSPRGLESQCASCHGPGKRHERTDYPAQGRILLQGIRDAREQLTQAESIIRRVKDAARREELEAAADQVRVPLIEAAQAGHRFVFRDLEERLDTARVRLAGLMERLASRHDTTHVRR